MFGLGATELFIIGIIAILLFGKNLPQVAAKLGKQYRDFRRSLSDIQGQFNVMEEFTSDVPYTKPKPKKNYSDYDDRDEPTGPKFEPPPGPPEQPA